MGNMNKCLKGFKIDWLGPMSCVGCRYTRDCSDIPIALKEASILHELRLKEAFFLNTIFYDKKLKTSFKKQLDALRRELKSIQSNTIN